MTDNSNRRKFFKTIFLRASELLSPPDPAQAASRGNDTEMASQIMGDLAPELMALEAQRLGLDPEKDQDLVLESVQAAMGRPKKDRGQ